MIYYSRVSLVNNFDTENGETKLAESEYNKQTNQAGNYKFG